MNKHKILVIGLDGATYDLLKPWTKEGKLPTLRRLLMEGAAGELESTIPPMTAPAWTSFMTGKNPGKHGLYDWIYRHRNSYEVSPVTASRCREASIWELLGRAGCRVCVVNVPMTYPPKPVNGLMIAGMPAPSTDSGITYPDSLLGDLEREVGAYLLYPDPGQAYSDSGVDAFLDRLYRTTDRRFEVVEWLRAREGWDFFMVVLNGTDTVQHAMWKYMSPAHPLHRPQKMERYGDAILRYFQHVDQKLGDIVAHLDEDTTLMLMSDHGFGPFHKFIHVNNWLREQGWLKIRRSPRSMVKAGLFRLGFAPMTVYNQMMRIGLGRLKREVVRGQGQSFLRTLFLSFEDVDWGQTAAYSLGNVGQIRLNVRGREPEGCVEPGPQYEEVREQIVDRLRQLIDPETGERVVQEIYYREQIYEGQYLDGAADILFIPTRMEYFGFGEYEFGSHRVIERMERGISGTHRPNGIFLMKGRPVKKGVWLKGARIVDLAPTILHLLGQPVPSDMDGLVLLEALKPEYRERRVTATVYGDRDDIEPFDARPRAEELSDDEEALIRRRLRGLGYAG